MSSKARGFIALVIVAGCLQMACGLLQWRSDNLASFIIYLIIAVLASGLKLQLPGVTGTISVSFVFVLIGVASLNLAQVLVVGGSSILVQYLWQSSTRLRIVQVLFNLASVSFAISASYYAYHSVWLRSLPLEMSVMLGILACVYFFCTTILIAAVIALTENKSIGKVWRATYLWSFPYYLLGAATAGLFEIAKHRLGWQTSMLVAPVMYLVYRSYRLYLGRLEDEKKHAQETAALHLRTIESLALAIEAKDHTTHDHLQRVQVYAIEIAKELNLSESEMQAVRAASLLHDIGKIAVPEHIICKPGKLTPEEFEIMKIHPVVGAEILMRAQFPYPVAPIVRSHHEKWDGSGYPDGLKGTEIPIGARILSAVDCLDALASDRQYRRALPLAKAMEMVAEQSGRAFDPEVVQILQKRYIELEQQARSSHLEAYTLSTDIKIERGAAPDAGFEQAAEPQRPASKPSSAPGEGWEALIQVVEGMTGILSRRDVFAILAARLQELMPFDGLAVYTRRGATLVPEYASGAQVGILSSLEIRVGEGLSGWVAGNGRAILNGNPSVDLGEAAGLKSALAIPLKTGRDVTGVLTLFQTNADGFSAADLKQVTALGSILVDPPVSEPAAPKLHSYGAPVASSVSTLKPDLVSV